MKDKIASLNDWCSRNQISTNSVERVYAMLSDENQGKSLDPLQYPNWYIKDPLATGWHDKSDYKWVKLLEDNFSDIQREALNIFSERDNPVHPDNDTLVTRGSWNTYFFYKNGEIYNEHHISCPCTSRILNKIGGVEIAGRTYFSEMTAHTHIAKHCGPHNFKLRTQLALKASPGSEMIVIGKAKQWEEGKCFVFDDSFEHEAINNSNQSRVVLIVDVWNQSLTKIEQQALEYLMPEFYRRA